LVDIHYFIFIMNVDSAIASAIAGIVVFALTYVALKLIYRMWRRNLKCPHCGEAYHGHQVSPPVEKALPNALWT
jgi:prepilin signal peptidase PulO-like enzyme (type II secretory pathway)